MALGRVYVDVLARFDADGRMRPVQLTWADGRRYTIDRVKDMRQAPSLKCGGQGDRYTVMIRGKESYLFFEREDILSPSPGRWFVECTNRTQNL